MHHLGLSFSSVKSLLSQNFENQSYGCACNSFALLLRRVWICVQVFRRFFFVNIGNKSGFSRIHVAPHIFFQISVIFRQFPFSFHRAAKLCIISSFLSCFLVMQSHWYWLHVSEPTWRSEPAILDPAGLTRPDQESEPSFFQTKWLTVRLMNWARMSGWLWGEMTWTFEYQSILEYVLYYHNLQVCLVGWVS